jgi:hypothetical protein
MSYFYSIDPVFNPGKKSEFTSVERVSHKALPTIIEVGLKTAEKWESKHLDIPEAMTATLHDIATLSGGLSTSQQKDKGRGNIVVSHARGHLHHGGKRVGKELGFSSIVYGVYWVPELQSYSAEQFITACADRRASAEAELADLFGTRVPAYRLKKLNQLRDDLIHEKRVSYFARFKAYQLLTHDFDACKALLKAIERRREAESVKLFTGLLKAV